MKGHLTVKPPCFGEALDSVESLEDLKNWVQQAGCEECPWLEQCLEVSISKLEAEEGSSL